MYRKALFQGQNPVASDSPKYVRPGKDQDHPTGARARVYLVAAKGVKGRGAGFALPTPPHQSLVIALQIPFVPSLYPCEEEKMKQKQNSKVSSPLEVEQGPGLVSLFP